MTILKLQNEGDAFTGKVTNAGEVAGNFGPQVKFDFEGGETLYLPKESADRQLARIPLGYAECVGVSLTFSRDPNPKAGAKPFWGIKLADIVDRARPAHPKRITATEAANAPPHHGALPTKPLPFDEEAFAERPGDGDEALLPPPPTDDDLPEWVEPKPTPREVAPALQKKANIVKGYVDLFAWMKEQLPEGTDDSAIQAASATVWLTWKDRGLLP